MMIKNVLKISLMSVLFAGMIGCSDDDDNPAPINEEETITRMVLTYNDGQTDTDVVWNDGEASPTIMLDASSNYEFSVKFYDATDPNDIEDITAEVIAEADEHFVVYNWTNSGNLSISRSTTDTENSSGSKIGLRTSWNTNAATTQSGQLEVKLYHEPTTVNDASGVGFSGSVTGGETDVLATFSFEVI